MVDEMDLHSYEDHDERLPWLETVEPDEEMRRRWGRILVTLVLVIAAAVGAVLGIHRYQRGEPAGNGDLIAAQEGDYKVKPDDPGGLKVSGEGQSAIAASAGKPTGSGAIDLNAVPEKPVAAHPAAHPSAPAATTGHGPVAAVPARGGKLVAAVPVTAARAGAASGGGGSLVQLGAYPSAAAADTAWGGFAKRFAYLAPLGKSVQPVASGGRTLYRLRVNAGSANAAADLCGRLKVAGEACFVAS